MRFRSSRFRGGHAMPKSGDKRRSAVRGGLRRLLAVVMSVTVLTSVLTAMQPAAPAEAISGADFDPGYIISDSEFYKGNAMSEAEIQAFLVSKGSVLRAFRNTVSSRA